VLIGAALCLLTVAVYQWGNSTGRADQEIQLVQNAFAAGDLPKASPVMAHNRDFYAPNSEDLAPDEMRLIACGGRAVITRSVARSTRLITCTKH